MRVARAVEGFVKAGAVVFPLASIARADFGRIEQLEVDVTLHDGTALVVRDIDAIELAMLTKPSVLESRRLRWAKRAWLVHNVIGHPLMQVLALFGAYKLAMRVHEDTVPRPLGRREPRQTTAQP